MPGIELVQCNNEIWPLTRLNYVLLIPSAADTSVTTTAVATACTDNTAIAAADTAIAKTSTTAVG